MLTFATPHLQKLVKDSDPSNTALHAVDHIDFLEFGDLEQSVKDDVKFLKDSALVLPETVITGWVYEVETGKVSTIVLICLLVFPCCAILVYRRIDQTLTFDQFRRLRRLCNPGTKSQRCTFIQNIDGMRIGRCGSSVVTAYKCNRCLPQELANFVHFTSLPLLATVNTDIVSMPTLATQFTIMHEIKSFIHTSFARSHSGTTGKDSRRG